MQIIVAKVYVRDYLKDFPQWNGDAFLLLDEDTAQLLELDRVLYNEWSAFPEDPELPIGRYNEIGYGPELPEQSGIAGEWREVPVVRVTAYPDDPEKAVILLLGRPPQWS